MVICNYLQPENDLASINGFWLTQDRDAVVEIFQDNNEFFGRITWLEEPLDEKGFPKKDDNNPDAIKRDQLINGLIILNGFRTTNNKKWTGGTIYDPENGKTYSCTMKLQNDELKIRGFVGISLLGRTEIWTRTNKP
ncbi:MAG: DUF2147 domain-containing protein [Candidatus Cloacimonetes bacterium]|nr:DUF2147 domain-containing protein [Candidatus Cloacimonadota bacterium]